MPAIAVRDITLHYEEAGAGDPLLLLHGGLGTALLHFRREIPVFAEYRDESASSPGVDAPSVRRERAPAFGIYSVIELDDGPRCSSDR